MNAARVVIDDTIRIRAEKIKLKNGTVEHAENIDRITSCKECENEHPLWYFTASSAVNDIQNQNIIYRDVTLGLEGCLLDIFLTCAYSKCRPSERLFNPWVNDYLEPGCGC